MALVVAETDIERCRYLVAVRWIVLQNSAAFRAEAAF